MVTIVACAMAIAIMVRNFGLPQERVIEFAVVSVILLGAVLLVAFMVACIARWIINKRQ